MECFVCFFLVLELECFATEWFLLIKVVSFQDLVSVYVHDTNWKFEMSLLCTTGLPNPFSSSIASINPTSMIYELSICIFVIFIQAQLFLSISFIVIILIDYSWNDYLH